MSPIRRGQAPGRRMHRWARTSTAWACGVLLLGLTACAGTGSGADPAHSPAGPQGAESVGTRAAAASSSPGPGAASSAGASVARSGSVNGGASAVRPVGPQPAFDKVIEGATRLPGLWVLWRKDDKVWIELAESDFDRPMFLSPKISSGIGEAGLFGGLMGGRTGSLGGAQWVEFRRVFNQVQLLARNAEHVAQAGTPQARAVDAAYSPSLLGSAPLASQPHPQRGTVLVEAHSLLAGDLLGIASHLQRSYRQGYGLDARHSVLLRARARPDEVVFEWRQHFATAAIGVAQPGSPPGTPAPSVPDTVPDPRSLFIGVNLSLTRLPPDVMRPRLADARLGHFVVTVHDHGDELARTPRRRFVQRWRLEKKDPTAEMSEPIKPITYWIDRDMPLAYRDAVRAGILEWNRAFERIGFRDAIVVQQQPDDADFDTLDTHRASIRWMTNAEPQFGAIGPTHVDPRSGEILDADIALESLSSRSMRQLKAQWLAAPVLAGAARSVPEVDWVRAIQSADLPSAGVGGSRQAGHEGCLHADLAAEQLDYAVSMATIRDRLPPDSPEVQAFVQAYLKEVTMHEVGHTLGLRHNFRASTLHSAPELADPRTEVLSGSVMEYAPVNLARRREARPRPFQTTLGPYDHWAIEYAYKPLAPADEAQALARLAGRSAEPGLAFATDEDHFLGVDPDALQGDLGDDPIAFAARRLDIAEEFLQELEARVLAPDDTYAMLRRGVTYALRDAGRSAGVLTRQIGGVRTLRDAPGTGRDPLQPVPAVRQRQALALLTERIFGPRRLQVSPALQRRLAPDFLDRGDLVYGQPHAASIPTDFSPAQMLLELQRTVLAQLMSDGVAQRLVDSAAKFPQHTPVDERSLTLEALQRSVVQAVWSDLDVPSGDLSADRRELQRDHANRLTALLLRPAALSRVDARSLWREQARELVAKVQRAQARKGLSEAARAHLRDVQASLQAALAAPLARSGG